MKTLQLFGVMIVWNAVVFAMLVCFVFIYSIDSNTDDYSCSKYLYENDINEIKANLKASKLCFKRAEENFTESEAILSQSLKNLTLSETVLKKYNALLIRGRTTFECSGCQSEEIPNTRNNLLTAETDEDLDFLLWSEHKETNTKVDDGLTQLLRIAKP